MKQGLRGVIRLLVVLLGAQLLVIPGALRAQAAPPPLAIDYQSPLDGPLLITGTFGELRSNHFHAGLDFRAKTGTPVLSVADGFVSRIVAKGGGYGQAVYVDHADGHRSVYAHLSAFAPELLDTLRKVQYAEERFSVDLSFDPATFPVSRGQSLGRVGNRGHSFGPHLHFEMREIAGDVPVNPLAFGFPIADTRRPDMRALRVYELDGQRLEVGATTVGLRAAADGRFLPERDTVVVSVPRIALGLKAFDRQNGLPNNNGPYAVRLLTDSTLLFRLAFDHIPFEQTEYLNALTDYADWRANTSWFYRLWAKTREAMFLDRSSGATGRSGSISLRPDQPLPLRVEVEDFAGNRSVADLTVVYRPPAAGYRGPDRPHQYYLPAGEPSLIDNGRFRLQLDSSSLYDPLYFRYLQLADDSDLRLSPTHQLHEDTTPLHGRATLSLRPTTPVADSLRQSVFIGRCGDDGRISSHGGRWSADGWMTTRIGSFGDYALFLDTLAPTIAIRRFPTDLRRAAGFDLLVEDNVDGGPLTYRGTIDGRWVLLEYEAKNGRLSHTFEGDRLPPGDHQFELTVTDARGNTAYFRRRFRR